MATYPDYDQAARMREVSDRRLELLASLRSFERLIDAAEHVVIIHALGENMDAVIAALRAALPKGRSQL